MAASALRFFAGLVGLILLAPTASAQLAPPDTAAITPSLEAFAKAHIAVSALRAQIQGELADPKTKKRDDQVALREKLRTNTARLLKEHGLTEVEFVRATRLVSADTLLRKRFEETLARLPGGKTP